MTQTLDGAGRPLFFPSSLATDDGGMILARPMDELAPLVDRIAADGLLLFTKRLVEGTKKRRRETRWVAVNRQRLLLARLFIDRALREGLFCVESPSASENP